MTFFFKIVPNCVKFLLTYKKGFAEVTTFLADKNHESYNQHLAQLVRIIRKCHNLGQREFAEAIDVSQSNISKIEAAHKQLNLDAWMRLCHSFQVTENHLRQGLYQHEHLVENLDQHKHTFRVNKKLVERPLFRSKFIYPILRKIEEKIGEKEINFIISTHLKMGPEYLACMDAGLNDLFLLEMQEYLGETSLDQLVLALSPREHELPFMHKLLNVCLAEELRYKVHEICAFSPFKILDYEQSDTKLLVKLKALQSDYTPSWRVKYTKGIFSAHILPIKNVQSLELLEQEGEFLLSITYSSSSL